MARVQRIKLLAAALEAAIFAGVMAACGDEATAPPFVEPESPPPKASVAQVTYEPTARYITVAGSLAPPTVAATSPTAASSTALPVTGKPTVTSLTGTSAPARNTPPGTTVTNAAIATTPAGTPPLFTGMSNAFCAPGQPPLPTSKLDSQVISATVPKGTMIKDQAGKQFELLAVGFQRVTCTTTAGDVDPSSVTELSLVVQMRTANGALPQGDLNGFYGTVSRKSFKEAYQSVAGGVVELRGTPIEQANARAFAADFRVSLGAKQIFAGVFTFADGRGSISAPVFGMATNDGLAQGSNDMGLSVSTLSL